MDKAMYYGGKKIDDMTREELVAAIKNLVRLHLKSQQNYEDEIETLDEICRARRRR